MVIVYPSPPKKNGDCGFAHIPHHKYVPKQMLRDEPKPKINMLVAFINLKKKKKTVKHDKILG